jgi:serine protease Do
MRDRSPPFRRSTLVLAVVATLALVPLAGMIDARAAVDRPAFADVVEQNSPAVVNIRSTIRTEGPSVQRFHGPEAMPGTPFDEFFRRFFEEMPHGPGPGGEIVGQGSGFIISADGLVVTNNHVIDKAAEITVVTNDGESYPATLVGSDPKTDLALLKIEADDDLPYLRFGDSDAARAGDWVLAIGNPFGLGGSATAGIISARGRNLQAGPYDDFLQIDAPINRGNSGGPVFNTDGEVIGVNTMIYSPNGGNVGIGFAIPSSMVAGIVEDLQDDGHVERGWLGVQIQGVTEEIADGLGLDDDAGALIARVEPGSPADKAGLKAGDVVVDFDGREVETVRDLTRMVADTPADRSVEVGVWRDGKRKERDVRIGQLEEEPVAIAAAPHDEAGPGGLGLQLSPLTPEARRQFGVPDEVAGALVVRVDPAGPAARQGLRPGDVISMVGQTAVDSPQDVQAALEANEGRDHALFRIERNGGSRFVAMKLA